MPRIATVLRLLLGLGFTVFALNYFVPFLPAPGAPPPDALAFLGAFAGAKYLTLIKVVELGAGLLLLSNRFVPLALALLAPIVVGIAWFHAVLAPAGIAVAGVFLVLEVALSWLYRDAFAPMLRARVEPAAASPPVAARSVARAA